MAAELSITGRAALIVNEMQLGVVDAAHAGFPGLALEVAARGIVARIAALADAFRARGLPIFHTPVVHRRDMAGVVPNTLINALTLKGGRMTAGSADVAIVPELAPHPTDIVIDRPAGLIAFNATTLDAMLRRMGVATVVLTGVSTTLAMPGNALTASDLGYHVVIPEDCTAGPDAAMHRLFVAEQLRMVARITTADAVVHALGTARDD